MANLPRFASGNPYLDMLIGGLGRRESSMNFGAVGPQTRSGDRAYGFSQVMGSNVGPWTQEVLGQSMSPDQYLNDPKAQFAVTSAKLGGYLSKYGNPADALSMWHSGRPMSGSRNASDGYVKTHDYVNQIMDKLDPRSFQANAPDAPVPNAPVGPQTFQAGPDDSQEPLSNAGSSLANMGSIVASLDKSTTGAKTAAALGGVAHNLLGQEALRQREYGWRYAGQTQNGAGMIFQNSRGQTRIEPLSPEFAGQRTPDTIRTLEILHQRPDLMDTLHQKNESAGQQSSLTDEGIEGAVQAKFAGRKDAYTGLTKQGKELAMNKEAEFKTKYGITDEDIMSNQGKWAGVFRAEGEYSKKVTNVTGAEKSLSVAIDQGRELLKDPELQKMMGDSRIFNTLNQFTVSQLNQQGLGKLAKAKEIFETIAQDYTRINAQGNSTTTVSAQDIARQILDTKMSPKAINELFDFMGQTGARVRNALEAGQLEMRANARKHTNLEDYQSEQKKAEDLLRQRTEADMEKYGLKPKTAQTTDSSVTHKAPSNISSPQDLMSWIQSQGLKKGTKFTLPDGTEGTVP